MYISLFPLAILGTVIKVWLHLAFAPKSNHNFQNPPLSTVLVNQIGEVIIAFSIDFFANRALNLNYKLIDIKGFYGDLTTFLMKFISIHYQQHTKFGE